MSDTPPPELVDHIARLGIPASERRPDALDRQRAWNMLQSLAEWADGGLIDPLTWTVVEVKKVARVVVDAWSMDGWPMEMHAELTDPADRCDGDPLWLLSPREGER